MAKFNYLLSFLFFFLGYFINVNAQYYNVVEEEFEGTLTWYYESGSGVNHFVIGECAGNSVTSTGSIRSMYVAPNTGVNNACTIGSDHQFAYQPSPTGTIDTLLIYTDIPTSTCAQNGMVLSFDYKLQPNDGNDYGVIIYRLNPSDNWTVLSNVSVETNSWSNASYILPASLEGQSYQLGFYYVFNDDATSGIPLAIDNFTIKGLDETPPIISCPGTQQLYGDATCSSLLPNYKNLATASDNCALATIGTFSQSPDMGEIAHGTTTITMTAFDASGNSSFCVFDITMIDTIAPTISCNESHLVSNNNNSCDYLMPDLSSDVTVIQDNCSTDNFSISQSIVAGSNVSGIKNVIIGVQDEQGNNAYCVVRTTPIDTLLPIVICPNDTIIDNGNNCSYLVSDFTNDVVATDNCTISSIVQVPVSGETISNGTYQFTARATDEVGNYTDCSFEVKIIEAELPQITFCPSDITTCDSLVFFNAITATDNCAVGLFKTDLTGLNSGDIFPIGTSHLQYTARDSSGNEAVCNFDITILASAEEPQIVKDPLWACNETSIEIEAVPATNGYWSLPNGSTLNLENALLPTTVVTNLAEGTNVVYWNTSSADCGNRQAPLFIYNYPVPSQADILRDTSWKCNDNNLLLSANPPTKGTGLWSSSDSLNTIINPQLNNAIVDHVEPGWNVFYYTVSSGVCPSSVDSIVVYKEAYPEILSFSDTTLCEMVSLSLLGNTPPEDVSSLWFFSTGIGEFSDEDSTSTLLTSYKRGTNEIVYGFQNPHCGWKYDTLTVNYGSCNGSELTIPNLITPNQDGKNDAFEILGLNDLYPNCKVTIINRWGGIVFESEGYTLPWKGTFKEKPVPTGTYYYVIHLNDDENRVINGSISVIQ